MKVLDLAITILGNKINYQWYRKETHSGNLLREDSHLPYHVKKNFIQNTQNRINVTCSSDNNRIEMTNTFNSLLVKNGYQENQIKQYKMKGQKKQWAKNTGRIKNNKRIPLVINYITERLIRKINNLITNHDLNIRLISKPGPCLSRILNRRYRANFHHNCKICKHLGPKYNCKIKNIVYKFRCKICGKEYIGQTARPFCFRYNEHRYSINKKNNISALSEHSINEHKDLDVSIDDFTVEFLDICKSPLECKLQESRWIRTLRPSINRRQELTHW